MKACIFIQYGDHMNPQMDHAPVIKTYLNPYTPIVCQLPKDSLPSHMR